MISALLLGLTLADEFNHVYEAHEAVTVWFSKLVPKPESIFNTELGYLPLFSSESSSQAKHPYRMSEVIEGRVLLDSHMEVHFLQETKQTPLCSVQFSDLEAKRLRYAVKEDWWMQLLVDDLPVWRPLGKQGESAYGEPMVFVYTGFHIEIHYNDNRIVKVLEQSGDPVKLEYANQTLHFSYSVTWQPSQTPFEARLTVLEHKGFFKMAAYVCTLFACSGATFLLADLVRSYFAILTSNNNMIELFSPIQLEEGVIHIATLKQMAGEIYRAPNCLLLLTMFLSSGLHLLAVALTLLLLVIFGYPGFIERQWTLVLLYSLYALLSGWFSGRFYKMKGGRYWKTVMVISLLAVPVLVAGTVLSAQSYSTAFPCFGEDELLLFLLVCAPLHAIGTYLGRKCLSDPNANFKANAEQAPLVKDWLAHPAVLIASAGILPGLCPLILYNVFFSTMYQYKLLRNYELILTVLLLLIVLVASVATAMTIVQIFYKDFRWPWLSFCSAGSAAGYLFLVAVHHYWRRPVMSELPPGWIYFAYMGVGCFCLFLVYGAIGYFASCMFLRCVYKNLKQQ